MGNEIKHVEVNTSKQQLPHILKLFDLTGKVAIVTGASSGLGREMATALALAGAAVMLVARKEQPLSETVSYLKGCVTDYFCADVSDSGQVQAMVAHTMEKFGRIDVLINNCGTTYRCDAQDFPDEEFDRILNVNLRSAFLCSKYAGREMLRQGSGSIINIGSGAGGHAIPSSAAYCTSKGGMVMLTKSMAIDWAQKGVRVNIIMPGTFRTPLLQACIDKDPAYGDKWLTLHPIGRFGEPEEIAGLAIYLASDNSAFMTGNVLYLDGGGHAGRVPSE